MADEIISTGIKLDTTDVEKGAARLEALAKAGERAAESVEDVGAAAQGAGKSIASLGAQQGAGIGALGSAANTAADGMSRLNRESTATAAAIGQQATAAKSVLTDTKSLDAAISSLTEAEKQYLGKLAEEQLLLTKSRGERAAYIAQSKGMSAAAQEMAKALGDQIEAAKEAKRATSDSTQKLSGSFGSLQTLIRGTIGVIGFETVRQLGAAFLRTADEVSTLNSRLMLATGSAAEARRAYDGLLQVANASRVSFTELGSTYEQIARSTQQLGLSSDRLLSVTDTIAKSLTIGGGSAASMQAALVQLSQGFASGVLRGEELNSVIEQTPRLAAAIAEGLGVTIGQLRAMGKAGELTADRVITALERVKGKIDTEFANSAVTTAQAFTVLKNSFSALIAEFDRGSGASTTAAQVILGVGRAVQATADAIRNERETFGTVFELMRLWNAFAQMESPVARAEAEARQVAKESAVSDSFLARRASEVKALAAEADRMDAAVRKFVSATDNMTRAQQKAAAQNTLLTQFANSVRGFAQDSQQYMAAYQALQVGLANIDAKFAERRARAPRIAKESFDGAIQQGRAYEQAVKRLLSIQTQFTNATEKTSAAQKVLNQLQADGIWQTLPDAWRDAILSVASYTDKLERTAEATKVAEAAQRAHQATLERDAQLQREGIAAAAQALKAERDRGAVIGLTTIQLEERTLALMDDEIAEKRRQLVMLQSNDADATKISNLEYEIELLRERRDVASENITARREIEDRAAMVKAAKDAESAWQKTADDINRGLVDSLFRAAESGKNAFESLRDAIRGMFNNLILRPIVQAIFSPITAAVGGLLGVTGAQAATASGIGGGLLSSASGLWTRAFSSFATSSIGSSLGLSTSLSNVVGPQAAAALGGNTAVLSGFGSALSTALPWIAAAGALYSLFSKPGGGPKSGGSSVITSSLAGALAATDNGRLYTPSASDADLRKLTESVVSSVAASVLRYGGQAGAFTLGLGFDTDPRGTAPNRISSFLSAGNRTLLANTNLDLGSDDAALQAGLALEVSRLIVAGLQASELPPKIAAVFDAIDVSSATQEVVDQAFAAANALMELSRALEFINVPLDSVLDATIAAAGGAQQLATVVSAYYDATRTDQEKLADTTARLRVAFGELGVAMPATMTEYRALVEGLMSSSGATTEAGQQLIVQLMALAPTMREVSSATDSLARSVSAMTRAAAGAIEGGFPSPEDWIAAGQALGRSDVVKKVLELSFAEAWQRLDLGAAFPQPRTVLEYTAALETLNVLAGESTQWLDKLGGALRLAPEFATLQQALQTTEQTIEQVANSIRSAMSSLSSVQAVYSSAQVTALRQSLYVSAYQAAIAVMDPKGGDLPQVAPTTNEQWQQLIDSLGGPLNTLPDAMQLAVDAFIEWQASIEKSPEPVTRAARAVTSTINDMAEKMRQAMSNLRDYVLGLFTSGDLLRLTPQQQLSAAQSVYEAVLKGAQAGDIESINSLGRIANDLLEAASAMFASTEGFQSIRDTVLADLQGLTGMTLPTTGRTYSQFGERTDTLPDYELTAFQQRDAQIDTLRSIDRRLARLEGRGRLANAR